MTQPKTKMADHERFRDAKQGVRSVKPAKLGAEKLTPEEQKRRFIEAAREAGASENEADLDAALKRIAKAKQERL